MKNIFFSLIMMAMLIIPTYLHSANIQVGAVVWYAWWNPQTEDSMRGENNPYTRSGNFSQPYNDTFESNQALIAGPYIGISFLERWNIGVVALISTEYEFTGRYNVYLKSMPSNVVHVDFNASGNRYDIDSTLSYTLYKSIKLFLGYKYMKYDVTGTYIANGIPTIVDPVDLNLDWEMVMQGPGIGISVNIPLSTWVFLPVSASFIQLDSELNQELTNSSTGALHSEENRENRFRGYGLTAGIGYYYETFGTVFILGGRYQNLKNEDDNRDEFYGISLSAIYTI